MKLKVLHNSIDYTLKMASFTGPANSFDFTIHPLYISFHKPLKNLYVELVSREETSELKIEYWNGSEFVLFPKIEDATEGFTKSGLIKLPSANQVKTDFDNSGKGAFWLKVYPAENPASVGINGVNLVLSNDKDFGFVPNIFDYLPDNLTSWIGFHQEARDMIVQAIRNSGKRIYRHEDLSPREVDQFDLLEIEEFRNASKYLALHLIFDYLSKGDDDAYAMKSKRYLERYYQSLNSNLMSIDLNDNGKTDEAEHATVQFIGIRRE
jgi:hypothetical protein